MLYQASVLGTAFSAASQSMGVVTGRGRSAQGQRPSKAGRGPIKGRVRKGALVFVRCADQSNGTCSHVFGGWVHRLCMRTARQARRKSRKTEKKTSPSPVSHVAPLFGRIARGQHGQATIAAKRLMVAS